MLNSKVFNRNPHVLMLCPGLPQRIPHTLLMLAHQSLGATSLTLLMLRLTFFSTCSWCYTRFLQQFPTCFGCYALRFRRTVPRTFFMKPSSSTVPVRRHAFDANPFTSKSHLPFFSVPCNLVLMLRVWSNFVHFLPQPNRRSQLKRLSPKTASYAKYFPNVAFSFVENHRHFFP